MTRRRKVTLTVEVETVMTVRELRLLDFMAFGEIPSRHTIRTDEPKQGFDAPSDCLGKIVQVQVNVTG